MTDAELLQQFESQAIPRAEWTHRAHVRVAYCYLRKLAFPEALDCLRRGIQRLNAANGTPDELDRGYHETVTRAFLVLIATAIQAHSAHANSDAFCDANPHLLASSVLRLYYTSARITSWQAKREFVEPDLAPLPTTHAQTAKNP